MFEFSVALLFCMFLGRGGRGQAKCEKKVHPHPEDDQNAKRTSRPGSGGLSMLRKCKEMQKTCKCSRKLPIFQIFKDFGNDRKLLQFWA